MHHKLFCRHSNKLEANWWLVRINRMKGCKTLARIEKQREHTSIQCRLIFVNFKQKIRSNCVNFDAFQDCVSDVNIWRLFLYPLNVTSECAIKNNLQGLELHQYFRQGL